MPATAASGRLRRCFHQLRGRILNNRALSVPDRAAYLNVAQHLFEHPIFFQWLKRRDDLCNVFIIHDLLSMDYPEFFSPANLDIFRRRLSTAFLHASAFIVSTRSVKQPLEEELRRQRSRPRPVHVLPFPSPLEGSGRASQADMVWLGHPYFVMLGTVGAPKKPSSSCSTRGGSSLSKTLEPPRLVIVGARGWETEQVADLLDRSAALRGHILELSGLSSPQT